TDADDFGLFELTRDFAQRNVRGNESNCEFSTGQTHGEIFNTAALREKFRLAREPESDFVHPGFVNRPGHDGIELAASGEGDRFFESSRGRARSFWCGLAGLTIWLAAEDNVFS